MKVYFDATPRKIEKYRNTYQAIGNVIESLGHELTDKWILDFDESFYDLSREEWVDHYRRIVNRLERADVAVLDISVSSTTIGQLIQQALVWGKPVIALKDNSAYANIFLEGAGDVESKVIVVEYTMQNLKQELKLALNYAEEWLETRFTMLIDGRIRGHLDRVAQSGKSRSEYIRELIEKDAQECWE